MSRGTKVCKNKKNSIGYEAYYFSAKSVSYYIEEFKLSTISFNSL